MSKVPKVTLRKENSFKDGPIKSLEHVCMYWSLVSPETKKKAQLATSSWLSPAQAIHVCTSRRGSTGEEEFAYRGPTNPNYACQYPEARQARRKNEHAKCNPCPVSFIDFLMCVCILGSFYLF